MSSRLWRSLKYEEVYLDAYASVAEAEAGIGACLDFYNEERQHQSLRYRTPRQIYEEGPWICVRSASPTGSAFAHIATGTTANQESAYSANEPRRRYQQIREWWRCSVGKVGGAIDYFRDNLGTLEIRGSRS